MSDIDRLKKEKGDADERFKSLSGVHKVAMAEITRISSLVEGVEKWIPKNE